MILVCVIISNKSKSKDQCDYCDIDTNAKDDREIIEDDNIAICDKVN